MQVRLLSSTPVTSLGEEGTSARRETSAQLPWLERLDGPATMPRGEADEHQSAELQVQVLVVALGSGPNGATAVEQTPPPAAEARPSASASCFGVDRFEHEAPTQARSNLLESVTRPSPGSAETPASSG